MLKCVHVEDITKIYLVAYVCMLKTIQQCHLNLNSIYSIKNKQPKILKIFTYSKQSNFHVLFHKLIIKGHYFHQTLQGSNFNLKWKCISYKNEPKIKQLKTEVARCSIPQTIILKKIQALHSVS